MELFFLPIFLDQAAAEARSVEIAIEQGVNPEVEETQEWFASRAHPITAAGALEVPDGSQSVLTPAEQAALLTVAEMNVLGWEIILNDQ